jgi:hypothetical protein
VCIAGVREKELDFLARSNWKEGDKVGLSEAGFIISGPFALRNCYSSLSCVEML